jgi:hypothetical protein
VATGLAATIFVVCHLFVPSVIGTSDTGDGRRLLCQIQAGDPHFSDGRNSAERFVAITYDPIPPNPVHCGAFRVTERYPSSALAVLAAAQQLTYLSGVPGALDIRFAGLLYSLAFGLVIGLFVLVLPGPRWARIAAAVSMAAIGNDAAFVPYFNSAFSEPMEYVALLAAYAGLLALWRRATVPPAVVVAVAVVFALLVTAKSQEIPLGVLLALALATVRSPLRRGARALARVVPVVAAVAVLVTAGTTLYLQPRLFNQQLVYTDVFFTILLDSPDVDADLRELGLPTALDRYAGKTYFAVQTQLATDPNYAVFLRTTTFSDVALFYARHPDRLTTVTGTAVRDVVKARHPLPNTTRDETARPEVVCRYCPVTDLGGALKPSGVVVWPLWELAVLAVGILLLRRRRQRPWRALGALLVTTVAFALFHVATAILGDGYAELGKHVFPAVVDTWLVVPMVALGVGGLLPRQFTVEVRRRARHAVRDRRRDDASATVDGWVPTR